MFPQHELHSPLHCMELRVMNPSKATRNNRNIHFNILLTFDCIKITIREAE